MIGKKIYKPLEDPYIYNEYGAKTKNPSESSSDKYSELASWCNKNNAMIVDQGDYYEAVPVLNLRYKNWLLWFALRETLSYSIQIT